MYALLLVARAEAVADAGGKGLHLGAAHSTVSCGAVAGYVTGSEKRRPRRAPCAAAPGMLRLCSTRRVLISLAVQTQAVLQ